MNPFEVPDKDHLYSLASGAPVPAHGRRRIFSVAGATMKRALMENICKRAQYDLPRPRSDNDGPCEGRARTLNKGRNGSLTKGRAVHFSTGQNKAAIQGGKECF